MLDYDTRGSVHETKDNINHTDAMTMMRLSTVADLTSVSYEFLQTSYIKPLPSMGDQCVVKQIYKQLYPGLTLSLFSLLYMHYKK